MSLRRRKARTHRIYGHMAGAERTPRLDTAVPFVFVQLFYADPGINTEILSIAASRFEMAMELLNIGFDPVVRRPPSRHPPVTESRSTLEHGLSSAPEPDGDRALHGQRINPALSMTWCAV